jgi:hypothetical protein
MWMRMRVTRESGLLIDDNDKIKADQVIFYITPD